MRGFSALLAALCFGSIIATGCESSGSCPCPAVHTGPGWCAGTEVMGTGSTCVCATSDLCEGWCLPSGATDPVPCGGSDGNDAGTGAVDARTD